MPAGVDEFGSLFTGLLPDDWGVLMPPPPPPLNFPDSFVCLGVVCCLLLLVRTLDSLSFFTIDWDLLSAEGVDESAVVGVGFLIAFSEDLDVSGVDVVDDRSADDRDVLSLSFLLVAAWAELFGVDCLFVDPVVGVGLLEDVSESGSTSEL